MIGRYTVFSSRLRGSSKPQNSVTIRSISKAFARIRAASIAARWAVSYCLWGLLSLMRDRWSPKSRFSIHPTNRRQKVPIDRRGQWNSDRDGPL